MTDTIESRAWNSAKMVLGIAVMAATVGLSLSGCTDNMMDLGTATTVASLTPASGASGVDPKGTIVIQFSAAMMAGMEQYVALHQGDISGPTVQMQAAWSNDRTRLTLTPSAPLASPARYTLHLGGGMQDSTGSPLDLDRCAGPFNGQWATHQMMGDGSNMMGPGWQHANGTYGMVFSFTTG